MGEVSRSHSSYRKRAANRDCGGLTEVMKGRTDTATESEWTCKAGAKRGYPGREQHHRKPLHKEEQDGWLLSWNSMKVFEPLYSWPECTVVWEVHRWASAHRPPTRLWSVGSAGEFRALANAFKLFFLYVVCLFVSWNGDTSLILKSILFFKAFASAMCVSRGGVVFSSFSFFGDHQECTFVVIFIVTKCIYGIYYSNASQRVYISKVTFIYSMAK